MEGRALDRQPYQGWAFMVPAFGSIVVSEMADAADAGRTPSLVVGLAAGVAWQLLYRRDLVSRLAVPAVLSVVVLVLSVLPGVKAEGGDGPALTYLLCVVVGLVLAELRLRRQDRRAGEVSPAEAPAKNPGTGPR